MKDIRDSEHRSRKRPPRGGRHNVYFKLQEEHRLQRLMPAHGGDLGKTINAGLVLLERKQTDYLARIQKVIHELGTFAVTGKGDKEQALQELTDLLDNELAAGAIAIAIMDLAIHLEFSSPESDQLQTKE